MKAPYKWLLEYVDIDKNIIEIGDALTLSGSKVEEIIETGKEIDKVVTGKITKMEKHPDADKLTICQVDIKTETIQIVTAATNMKENDIVPVALHGSTLHGGLKIKKGKLRGVESNGMFCSEAELGLANEEDVHGLMILPQDTLVGEDIKEVLGALKGGVIDFEITSNRSDCFGVYGLSREIAATFGANLKKLDTSYRQNNEDINNYLKVDVQDKLCRRYAAKMIKNVKIAESPEWLKQKLEQSGVRAINNIVDITNYILLELGQPLHAFDYRDLQDKTIIVRRAKENEKITTLDGIERNLTTDMLVIADNSKPVAIAGVMGGENSEIKDDTNTVIFEIANFNGTNIRVTSKKLALRTEASGKYEKDLDPNLVELALNRACHLIEELGAGEVVGGVVDIYKDEVRPFTLEVSPKWINEFLGTAIPVLEMKRILQSLELKVEGTDLFKIEVPTFRQDIKIREDVAEEVARIYGYNNLPSQQVSGTAVAAAWTLEQKLIRLTKNLMVANGLSEAMNFSFVSPKIFDKIKLSADDPRRSPVVISNPLGEDFSIMRTTGIASIMECLQRNYAKDNSEAALFEIARTYIKSEDVLPEEKDMLVIGMYGEVDFYTLKGIIESLISELGIDKAEYVRESENPTFHPGKTAKLLVRRQEAGVFGEVHPDVAEGYGIDDRVYIAEIDLKVLFAAAKMERKNKPLPKFPAVTRDIAMLIEDEVLAAEVEAAIKKAGKGLVESIKLFDVYKGKQIPEGLKSMAYSITYRADRTLKDEEVNKVHEAIVNNLKDKLKAELR